MIRDLTGQIIGCNKVLYRVPTKRGTNAWWRIKCTQSDNMYNQKRFHK